MPKDWPCPPQAKGRYHPSYELLEGRLAPAAGGGTGPAVPNAAPGSDATGVVDPPQDQPLTVTLIDPAPGSVVYGSPSTLTLQFNNPIFPDTLSTDVGIIQTDADGNPTGWYTVPDQLTLDPSGTVLTVSVGQVLPPGYYQVWIFGTSGITDLDGNLLVPDGNNLILGTFDVSVAGVTLAAAVDLPTPGTIPQEVPGSLDFQANPYAVNLYRFTLAPGDFWLLGLEVTAQPAGEPLASALGLFNAQGQPIASDDIGRQDTPNDPYLFAGLQPGTYYVGVSGTGNLPGMPGGYDPVIGSPGSVPQTQPGGPYTLSIVADPVTTPPELRSFAVDFADPDSTTPTGLTLAFTRAIALSESIGALSSELNQGVEVVDQSGRIWPIEASGYDEAQARISYIFDEPLPPGQYTVRLPPQGGLVDLAGLSPVAPGEPPGVLGSFEVLPPVPSLGPHNLGILFPDDALQGRSLDLTLGPGAAVTYRVVLIIPALYQFEIQTGGVAPSVQVMGAGQTWSLAPTGTNDTQLMPGVYTLRAQNPGPGFVQAQLVFRVADFQYELVLANGVGQGPALSLRLISFPGSVISTSSSFPLASPSPAIDLGGLGSALGPPTVSLLGLTTDLIGRPSPAILPESSEAGIPSPQPAAPFHLANAGGLVAGTARELERESGADEPAVADVSASAVSAPIETLAAGAGWSANSLTSLIDGLRQGARRLTAAVSAWVGSWSGGRPTSGAARREVGTAAPDVDRVRSQAAPEHTAKRGPAQSGHQARGWTKFVTMAIVALSGALAARMSRPFTRWCMARKPLPARGVGALRLKQDDPVQERGRR